MKKKILLCLKVLFIIVYLINTILLQKVILEVFANDKINPKIEDKYDYPDEIREIFENSTDKIITGEAFEIETIIFLFILQLLGIGITLINREKIIKFIIIYFICVMLFTAFNPIRFKYLKGGVAGYDEREYYTLYSIKYESGCRRYHR